jgi:hypothetical protein
MRQTEHILDYNEVNVKIGKWDLDIEGFDSVCDKLKVSKITYTDSQ